ncbi:hypothetical protein SDC9_189224 [bioreactor metagenome]|uniref:Uncharacterized protein n=1 Tax=bioreactor metagenome TaxID=1076179 RepID=A0A645HS46_9ZZZZ
MNVFADCVLRHARGKRIDWNNTVGIQMSLFQRLILGVLHLQAAQIHIDLAGNHQLGAAFELIFHVTGDIRPIAEKDQAQKAGAITDDHFDAGLILVFLVGDQRALHGGDDGQLIPILQTVDRFEL